MSPKNTMLRAAELLDEDAQAEADSCKVGDKLWACPDCVKTEGKCAAMRSSNERREIAAALRFIA